MAYKKFPVSRFFILLCLILLPYRLYHFTYPLADSFNFRQTQTATFAINMYKNGINMLRTELDIFGTGKERYLTLEFPLYEAMTALIYRLISVHDYWGRTVSLLAGYIGAWYVMKWVILVTRKRAVGLLSAFFFLTSPLSMFYHRAFMIEPTLIACLLIGLYYSCHWIAVKSPRSYILGAIFLTLGFIQKGLYGPFWLLPIGAYYWMQIPRPYKRSLSVSKHTSFVVLILLPLFSLLLWQHHINLQNAANGQIFFTTADPGHQEWNFGLLSDRLSWPMWNIRLVQIINGVLLKPGLALLFFGLLSLRRFRGSPVLSAFLLSAMLYFLVVFRIQVQNYYQLILVPAFAPVMAAGMYDVFRFVKTIGNATIGAVLCGLIGGVFLWKSWSNIVPSYYIDWAWLERIQAIGSVTPASSTGIFAVPGNEWNSIYTYYSGRKMKSTGIEGVTVEMIGIWKSQGYSFIVLFGREQYPEYLAKVKPGHSLDFLSAFPKLMENQEFQVYQL